MTDHDEHAATERAAAGWCARCGAAIGDGDHLPCDAALVLEPPRYCTICRRRMVVQVVPTGWTARCVEHGELRGGNALDPLPR
jgi:hypothetical protein